MLGINLKGYINSRFLIDVGVRMSFSSKSQIRFREDFKYFNKSFELKNYDIEKPISFREKTFTYDFGIGYTFGKCDVKIYYQVQPINLYSNSAYPFHQVVNNQLKDISFRYNDVLTSLNWTWSINFGALYTK